MMKINKITHISAKCRKPFEFTNSMKKLNRYDICEEFDAPYYVQEVTSIHGTTKTIIPNTDIDKFPMVPEGCTFRWITYAT